LNRSRAIAKRFLRERRRVGAEVELQRVRVDAEEVVLVGAERQAGSLLRAAMLSQRRPSRSAAGAACRRTRSPSSRRAERGLERRDGCAPGAGRLIGAYSITEPVSAWLRVNSGRRAALGQRARPGSCGAGRACGPTSCIVVSFRYASTNSCGLEPGRIEVTARLEHVERIAELLGAYSAASQALWSSAARRIGCRRLHQRFQSVLLADRICERARADCATTGSRCRCWRPGSRRCAGPTRRGPIAPNTGELFVIQRTEAPPSSVSKSASSGCTLTSIAFLKPIRSNALFHSRMPAVIASRYFSGIVRSSQ
jgi:hypothetical protein